jgi:glyoxylase-like metal-dependent hydrolase (beta-lactamase superfamily II)
VTSDHYRFEQVSPNAWAAVAIPSGAAVGNAGFASGLVIDCGFMPAGAHDLRAAAGLVDRLFITHADFDHYGGAQAFGDVPILASEQTAATIREVGPGRVTGMKEQIDTHLAELEERDAPEWEKEQGRRIAAEVPGLVLTPPTETFSGERELDGAVVIDCGAAHTASDSVVWIPVERVLYTGDLVGVKSHLNLSRGFPAENWLAILDRLAALEPEHVVPGHGEPAGPEALATARRYVETVVELANTEGDHEVPAEFAGWEFAEGFQGNIDARRAR